MVPPDVADTDLQHAVSAAEADDEVIECSDTEEEEDGVACDADTEVESDSGVDAPDSAAPEPSTRFGDDGAGVGISRDRRPTVPVPMRECDEDEAILTTQSYTDWLAGLLMINSENFDKTIASWHTVGCGLHALHGLAASLSSKANTVGVQGSHLLIRAPAFFPPPVSLLAHHFTPMSICAHPPVVESPMPGGRHVVLRRLRARVFDEGVARRCRRQSTRGAYHRASSHGRIHARQVWRPPARSRNHIRNRRTARGQARLPAVLSQPSPPLPPPQPAVRRVQVLGLHLQVFADGSRGGPLLARQPVRLD